MFEPLRCGMIILSLAMMVGWPCHHTSGYSGGATSEWEQLAWALCPQWCPDNARSTTMITPVGCDVIVSQQPGDITTQGWHWFEPSKLRHSREFTNGCSRASLQTYSVRTLGVFKSISIQLTRQLFGSPAGTGVAYLPEVQ